MNGACRRAFLQPAGDGLASTLLVATTANGISFSREIYIYIFFFGGGGFPYQ